MIFFLISSLNDPVFLCPLVEIKNWNGSKSRVKAKKVLQPCFPAQKIFWVMISLVPKITNPSEFSSKMHNFLLVLPQGHEYFVYKRNDKLKFWNENQLLRIFFGLLYVIDSCIYCTHTIEHVKFARLRSWVLFAETHHLDGTTRLP